MLRHLIFLLWVLALGKPQFEVAPPLVVLTFQQFKNKYSKTYADPGIEKYREIVFNNNKNLINQHNQGLLTQPVTYTMGEN